MSTSILSPVLDSLIDPFGASPADIGLLISVFLAPPIVMTPIAGIIADRYGRKPILVTASILFGVAGTAIAFTTSFQVALFLRFLQGVAFGGLTPIVITSIGDLYTDNQEATAQGIRFTGSGVAGAFFPILSGVLVGIAWQYPFLLYFVAIPIGVVLFFWFDEPMNQTSNHDGDNQSFELAPLLALLRYRQVAAMVIARGLPSVVWLGFVTYNSLIVIRVIGGTPTDAGILVAIGSFVYAVSSSQTGRVTAFFASRITPLLFANAGLGIGLVIVLVSPDIVIAGLGIALSGFGFGIMLSLIRSIITGLASESLRGGLVSIAEANGRLAGTVTPIFMGGIIATFTPILGFTVAVQLAGFSIAIIGSVGGVLCLLIVKYSPPPPSAVTTI